jgi:hypothetical protein
MNKKSFLLPAVACLLLSLVACGGDSTTKPVDPPVPPVTPPAPPVPPVVPPGTTGLNWSDAATWQGFGVAKPKAGDAVTIPAGKRVLLDENTPDLAGLTVMGQLEFADKDLELQADWIMLHGALKIGEETKPFTKRATITLNATNTNENQMSMGTRGILMMGGQLLVFGQKPATVWTKISDHAGQGANRLTLKDNVDWAAGSKVVVAPTDFFPHDASNNPDANATATEMLELTSAAGSTLNLKTGLQKSRWGKLQYVDNNGVTLTPTTSVTNLVLDQRAAVGNLSRNVVIQSADDDLWKTQGFGAHIMAMTGSMVRLDGVELRRMGQLNRLGRYPVHFHSMSYNPDTGAELGDATGNFVRNSAIWESTNRCVTIHATNGLQISNNICYDIKGHAIFLEDAVERRNVIENNLVLDVRNPPRGNQAPAICTRVVDGQRDCRLLGHDGQSSGFWLTNPDNTVRNNLAGDAQGKGFWLAYPRNTLGISSKVAFKPNRMPFGIFEGNTAHSSIEGMHIDDVPTRADPGQTEIVKYIPMKDGYNTGVETDYDYSKWLRFKLERITIYKNGTNWGSGAFWNRVSWPDYVGWVSADNTGAYFAGAGDNGRITGSLIIGTSLNSATPLPNRADPQVGFASYHSTFDMDNNVSVNFPFTPKQPGSGAFKTNDYYITAVDKGLVRNPGNRFIKSDPGYRVLPSALAPDQYGTNENWTLAGALWDAHGYWGTKENFWVYDVPFLTRGDLAGQSCTGVTARVLAPGVSAVNNGSSCNSQYYGVGGYLSSFDPNMYIFKAPIEVSRRDPANIASEVGRWTVADGNTANKLGNMRHFAARKGGYYVLRFPKRSGGGYDNAQWIQTEITNAMRADDWFVVGIGFDGATAITKNVYLAPNNAQHIRRTLSAAGSLSEVVSSSGNKYWKDSSQNLVWVKVVGGLKHPDYDREAAANPKSDFALYGSVMLYINKD